MGEDKIYEEYIEVFERVLTWCNGKYCHYEDLPESRLEVEIQRARSNLSNAKRQNWYYASWRNVDRYKTKYEYLTSIIKRRYDGYKYITF